MPSAGGQLPLPVGKKEIPKREKKFLRGKSVFPRRKSFFLKGKRKFSSADAIGRRAIAFAFSQKGTPEARKENPAR